MKLDINFSGIKWADYATSKFWFAIDRAALHNTDKLILILGAVLFVIGIAVFVYAKVVKNQFLSLVARRVAKIFVTIGLLEVLWFGLRYELVQVFGTHFTAALILIFGLVWLYFPIKYLISHYEADMERAQREASREKYLNVKK